MFARSFLLADRTSAHTFLLSWRFGCGSVPDFGRAGERVANVATGGSLAQNGFVDLHDLSPGKEHYLSVQTSAQRTLTQII